MRMRICILLLGALLCGILHCHAQLYTGMSGLIKNPSADMNDSGDAVIASYFMNRHFTPGDAEEIYGFVYDGKKYDTVDFSLALTPFRWLEVGYTFTLQKTLAEGHTKPRYNQKDRFFSIKLRPLQEGRYHPAIAIGTNDFIGSALKRGGYQESGAGYFCNYYIVATKHFVPKGQDIGVTLGYRYVPVKYGKKWQGVIGGVTWRPVWVPQLRLVGEWTVHELNLGVDCLLWKHLFLQFSMVGCRYPQGGIAYQINLF